jgi:oxygen-dependent protoporphyrinogen oxidase
MKRRIVIVGAGIAGLATAFAAAQRGADVIVLEHGSAPGGTVRTLEIHGCVVDAGPEALVATRPEALAFCDSLGIADEMVAPDSHMSTWLARRSGAWPLPDGLAMGIPRRLGQLVTTRLLSWPGKLRASLDLVLPSRDDPALGALIDRRLGREVKERLIEPIFGGIYGSDVDNLETAFVAPHLAHAQGSLIRAIAKQRIVNGSPLRAPLSGMGRVVDALVGRIGHDRIRLASGATRFRRTDRGWRVDAAGLDGIEADRVVIAAPPHAATAIARSFDAPLSDLLARLRSHSTASVVLGFDARDVCLPAVGGVLVPRDDAGGLLGATIVSNRWPASAPEGTVIIRAIVGGARAPELVDGATDDTIACEALYALTELLPLPPPRWQQVVRFSHAQVAPEVGHMRRVAHVRERAASLGGLSFVGSAYDGGGIAGILARAERTADELLAESTA